MIPKASQHMHRVQNTVENRTPAYLTTLPVYRITLPLPYKIANSLYITVTSQYTFQKIADMPLNFPALGTGKLTIVEFVIMNTTRWKEDVPHPLSLQDTK